MRACVLLSILLLSLCSAVRAEENYFQEHIAPILQRRCLSCHNQQESKGNFSLQTAAVLESGYIEPGDSEASYLLDVLTPVDGKAQMPKNADPLAAAELAKIRKWIDSGAKWPQDLQLTEPQVADLDWWSLRPLVRPELPETKAEHPIDAFLQVKRKQHGLSAAKPADRRTLIRRLYFDLIGLPPTPEEIQQFVDDPDPEAYERLVDRLLDSPHYGERWARHWLDVVHYADTHGYDKDKPRPHAWPYRDYVIRSFNQDKPYTRFVKEQIAGDAIWPDTVDGMTATGFIAAGPWDFIGHKEVPETKIDGKIARHLDRDDMVTSTMNTFCSVTVQCARCHNHKFDPVTQEHYYSLQAVFAALDRADRPFDPSPQVAGRRRKFKQRLAALHQEQVAFQEKVQELVGDQLTEIDTKLAKLESQQPSSDQIKKRFGYHSRVERDAATEKWVQVDLGEPTEIQSILYVGCHDTFNDIGHGFGFPQRYKIEACNDAKFQTGVTVLLDHTQADVPNPGTTPQTVLAPQELKARFVRITATKLAPRRNDFIFALAELMVLTPPGENAAFGKKVTALDSIESGERWARQNLVDGYYLGAPGSEELRQEVNRLQLARQELLERNVPADLKAQQEANRMALSQTRQALESLPKQQMVYAGTVYHGKGNFRGTGPNGGKPRTIHVLHRGNIQQPREEVGPGTIPVIPELGWKFELPPGHHESDRRVALAEWIVHQQNPLTWRSVVNRVWQYHFGRGIVDTPNDFGRMGKRPTHPELLDWLAVEFRDRGQSFKQLHKLIVTSEAYRQSSQFDPQHSSIDKENLYLWRMNRRRLTAEEIRDAVLFVSGKLNREMYGPGFQLFEIERPQHSPHYKYQLHDPNDPKSHRRSIYRFIVRSQPDPFLTTLDCADSSQSVPKRDETITALQALSLLNNKFMLAMAEHAADHLRGGAEQLPEQVQLGFQRVTGRSPTRQELDLLTEYAREHGLENLCRVLFNLNEFVFVE